MKHFFQNIMYFKLINIYWKLKYLINLFPVELFYMIIHSPIFEYQIFTPLKIPPRSFNKNNNFIFVTTILCV